MQHFDGLSAAPVENQVIAERAPADAEMFVARHQRIAARRFSEREAFFPQLMHKAERRRDTVACNIFSDGFEIEFGLRREDDNHGRLVPAFARSIDSTRSKALAAG